MNHRERALAALRHQEPDRVPIDFGGTVDSTISALNYQELRNSLGLVPSTTRVGDIYQYTAIIEDDVCQALGVDTVALFDEPQQWRQDTLPDGSPVEFPARFLPRLQADGSQVVLDAAGNVTLKMPANGYYFDPVSSPLAGATSIGDINKHLDAIETYDTPSHLDKTYEDLAETAKTLHEETDRLVVGFFGGHILQAGQSLRGWEAFLMDLLVNQKFAEALMDRLAEANIRRFERFAKTVGRYVHVVHFEDDLGMQDRPLLRPSLYRQLVKPYHQKLLNYVKSHCDAYILFHSDGAIAPLIPDFQPPQEPQKIHATGPDPGRTLLFAVGDTRGAPGHSKGPGDPPHRAVGRLAPSL